MTPEEKFKQIIDAKEKAHQKTDSTPIHRPADNNLFSSEGEKVFKDRGHDRDV